MITQNPLGQIILPPIYPENITEPVYSPFFATTVTSLDSPQITRATTNTAIGQVNVSATSIALILLGILTITTILYYWNYLKRYKRTPIHNFVRLISTDPNLKPRLNQRTQ